MGDSTTAVAGPFCPRCRCRPTSTAEWRCRTCDGAFDLTQWSAPQHPWPTGAGGLWRYFDWLPTDDRVSLGEPLTPLVQLSWPPFHSPVRFKLEGTLPTGSFKDRGTAVAVARFKSQGVGGVVIDSSGNAGASLAAYAASVGLGCRVYVPETASPAKLVQIRAYGAEVVPVPGTRARATDAAVEAAGEYVYGSHMWNPYFLAGTQTFAFELIDQLAGEVPDAVVFPLGAGTLLLGAYLGFRSLATAGLIKRVPRLFGVQVAACPPLARAMAEGTSEPAHVPCGQSLAEGILIARPPRGSAVLRAVRRSGGDIVSVEDSDVARALIDLASRGIYVEPTSAVAAAGLRSLASSMTLDADVNVIVALTGNGLKAGHVFERLASSSAR